MGIKEVRELLSRTDYLYDKNIDPSTISSGKKYYFTCEKGHIFDSLPCNAIKEGKIRCPVCSGRRVEAGYNDLWTTHPEFAKHLKTKDDGYKYSFGSNVKLWWICPDCKNEMFISPNKFINRLSLCNICSSLKSYGEKFMTELLNQSCVYFEPEKVFDCSNNRYLPEFKCIIEIHGKQHYSSNDFSKLGGKTYIEEQINDEEKMQDAKLYEGIDNYFVIDCSESNLGYVKTSIINSGLLEFLFVYHKEIDWIKCHRYATSNRTKQVCERYASVNDLNKLSKEFKLSKNTIRKILKDGNALGWCNYDMEENERIRIANLKNNTIKNMSKPIYQINIKTGEIIDEYISIQEAQRQLKISHIWDCLVGKRKSAGGYIWKYKKE